MSGWWVCEDEAADEQKARKDEAQAVSDQISDMYANEWRWKLETEKDRIDFHRTETDLQAPGRAERLLKVTVVATVL